jgi:hypothetical protein
MVLLCGIFLICFCIKRDNPFDPINQKYPFLGRIIFVYNDSTLINAFLEAQNGDTIKISSGIYKASLRFNNSGSQSAPIVVMGDNLGSVILHAPATEGILFISNKSFIEFYNIIFDSSYSSGVKTENSCLGIKFVNCIFKNCELDGLEITDSDVLITNCQFINNKRSGIRISGDPKLNNNVIIKNILSVYNGLEGISILSVPTVIKQATLCDNGKTGILITTPSKDIEIKNSILAFNLESGISGVFDPSVCNIMVDSVVIFSTGTNIMLEPATNFNYFSYDPMFTNRSAIDYSITSASPLNYIETQTGSIIGYRK